MGYELHITRQADWLDDDGPAITLDEWLAVAEPDAELRIDGAASATTPAGETITVQSPGLVVWTAYSGHGVNGNMAWFDHHRGEIVVKNPDDEIIRKMLDIAALLGARVQGDDGEIYDRGS